MKTNIIFGGFRKRDLPIAADYRPMYKIGLVVCILKIASNANRATLNRLHFFVWALRTLKNTEYVEKLLASGDLGSIVSWGIEPALNKALMIGVAENILKVHDYKYELTETGLNLYKKIRDDKEVLTREIAFLERIGKRGITESLINELTQNLSN